MKKIVFFLETNSPLTGMQTVLLDMAAYLADHTENDVYYVNNLFKEDIERVGKSSLTMCDLIDTDFSMFEDACFVVPVNYLFFLLTRVQSVKNAKILLYFYDSLSLKKLFNQAKVPCQKNSFLSIVKGSRSYLFADRPSYNAASCDYGCFYEQYLPQTIPYFEHNCEPKDLCSENEINIAYYGAINSKDLNSIKSLLPHLLKADDDTYINFHLIGSATGLLTMDFSGYSPKIRFICTGALKDADAFQYMGENCDLVLANNEYALKAASIKMPTVIPITSLKQQNDNRYVFLFDVQGYKYNWDRSELLASNNKMTNFTDILRELQHGNKVELSERCYDYYMSKAALPAISSTFLNFLSAGTLSLKKIRSAEFVIKQLACYSKYAKKAPVATYGDFLATYGTKRTKQENHERGGFVQAIKRIVKKFVLIVKRHRFMNLQRKFPSKIRAIRKGYEQTKKIKVAFIIVFNSVFPTRPVFELMLKDPAFDPYIIVAPNISRSFKYQMQLYNEAFSSLNEQYPGRVIHGYNRSSDSYLELNNDYDIVFFCNPYKHLVHKYHEIEYFNDKKSLTLYSSYGFAALSFWDEVIATDFYNYLWKACVETQSNLDHLKRTELIRGKNGVVTGYIKVDKMAEVVPKKRKRKRILICPHHTVWGWKTLNISNFLEYKDFFIELPKLFPRIDFVFRPHPLLFSNLKAYKNWSQADVDDYLEKLLQSPNITYDTSGEYFDKFINSDAMIHDCGSFIGEYLYTEKPCCYMTKNLDETMDGLVPLGKKCMEQYYHAFSKDDIIHFIQDVVIKNNDPLRQQRTTFVRTELKKNYPHAAETVVAMIKKELKIK